MTTLDTRPRAPGFRPLSLDSSTGCRPVANMAKTPPPKPGVTRSCCGAPHADRRRRPLRLRRVARRRAGIGSAGRRKRQASPPACPPWPHATDATPAVSGSTSRSPSQPCYATQRTEMKWSPSSATSIQVPGLHRLAQGRHRDRARSWPPNRGAGRGQQPVAMRTSPDFSSLTRNVPSGRIARPWAALTPVTRVLTVPDDRVTALIVWPPLSAT